jgi:hypothetical protein
MIDRSEWYRIEYTLRQMECQTLVVCAVVVYSALVKPDVHPDTEISVACPKWC